MGSPEIITTKSVSTDESKQGSLVLKEVGDDDQEDVPNSSFFFSGPEMILYQGFWNLPFTVEDIKSAQQNFMAREGDVLLSSFPKTGTTWLKSLAFAVLSRNLYKEDISKSPLTTNFPHDCVPYIEYTFGGLPFKELLEGKHRLAATHMPYSSLPSSVLTALRSGLCKIIYIWRDPKDTVVSVWHFIRSGINMGGATSEIPLESMVDQFCEGKVVYGPYWNHIIGYWEASKEYPENILFLNYEDMKRNTKDNVKRLAEFVGCPFSEDEEKAGEVEKIIDLCSFKTLSNLEVNKLGIYEGMRPGTTRKTKDLFRKGEVGDWKEYLTPDMKNKLDLVFEEKFKGHFSIFGTKN